MLFKSVSYALKAEKILKQEGLPHKLIPVPKQISSDCGVCLRFESEWLEKIQAALTNKVEMEEIKALEK
jgi:bacterioferritin-associated ferredoxin